MTKKDPKKKTELAPSTREQIIEKIEAGVKAQLDRALGGANENVQDTLTKQVINAQGVSKNVHQVKVIELALSAAALLEEIKPRDGLERLLATQMVANHNAALSCYHKAMHQGQTLPAQEMYFKHAEKLNDLYLRQLNALNKHRGKAQQKVSVKHIHVEAGAQAVVGNVGAQSTSSDADNNSGNSSKALSHAPAQVMDLPAQSQKQTVKRKT